MKYIIIILLLLCSVQYTRSNECSECEYFVDFIRYELNLANKTIADITKILIDICSKIIGPGGKECIVIADDLKEIIQMISQGINNTNICKDLHLCNTKNLFKYYI